MSPRNHERSEERRLGKNPVSLEPPIAYIFPFTAATPKQLLACCIGAFDCQKFAVGAETGLSARAIRHDAVKKSPSSNTMFLLMFTLIKLE